MKVLLDTSILLRHTNKGDSLHQLTEQALLKLKLADHQLYICGQNLIEFRSVVTRPVSSNGLGLSSAEAESRSHIYEQSFLWLPDVPDIFPAWKSIVAQLGIIGKQVHDARLVAYCRVHHVEAIFTYNINHFRRMATILPSLVILDPATV